MPWFPDFAGAVELVRRQSRDAGRADPVGQYFIALNSGDTHDLEDVWPGEVVVYDPHAGEIRGHRHLRQFVKDSRAVLAEHQAHCEPVASTVEGDRAVVEFVAHILVDGQQATWPVAVVAESPDDRSMVFRSYFSQKTVRGGSHVRSPILDSGPAHPGDVVGRYQAALAAGDTEAVVRTFGPEGYFREAVSTQYTHRGTAELRSYFSMCFSAGGGIDLEHCAVTDDGVQCALEFNCVRWGDREMPPQAGLAVYERGSDGLLAAARVYDDIEPPIDRA